MKWPRPQSPGELLWSWCVPSACQSEEDFIGAGMRRREFLGLVSVAIIATLSRVAVTMISTLSRTNSVAISEKRSPRPSAQRISIATVLPSIQPSSPSRCSKARPHTDVAATIVANKAGARQRYPRSPVQPLCTFHSLSRKAGLNGLVTTQSWDWVSDSRPVLAIAGAGRAASLNLPLYAC